MEIFEVKEAYRDLKESIEGLCQAIGSISNGFVATREGPFSYGKDAADLAIKGYSELFYGNNAEDGRHTDIWIGALGVCEDVLTLATLVNSRKDQFQTAVQNARNQIQELHKVTYAGANKSFRGLMADIGLSQLSLRQAYRHIPILTETPKSIGFSFSSGGRSIKRLSPEQALSILIKSGFSGENIEIERKKIERLSPDTVLAQVHPQAGYFKANIRFAASGESDEIRKQTMPVFLPILYLNNSEQSLVKPLFLPPQKKAERKQRNDRKLEKEPFVKSLSLYSYKQNASQ